MCQLVHVYFESNKTIVIAYQLHDVSMNNLGISKTIDTKWSRIKSSIYGLWYK